MMLKSKGRNTRTLLKLRIKKQYGIGKQGELSKKFKDAENFFDNVGQSRSTLYLKISLYKFLKKKSTVKPSYFKK